MQAETLTRLLYDFYTIDNKYSFVDAFNHRQSGASPTFVVPPPERPLRCAGRGPHRESCMPTAALAREAACAPDRAGDRQRERWGWGGSSV